ncbi:hypothetical protein [Streptomyces swartbergensis]|uniref:Uncharacterized protein n=1 Tax=Streptomyces swartbergensis TaxID=487165 RepID=A0A243RRZ7_9ACTN|nr:hypothetical protein [Streptomyces swartbergensis]OUC97828.1 hypothetical protein CA983_30035 [Streptomyces swartbergensis]
MRTLDEARNAAAAQWGGEGLPKWRTAFTTHGSDAPTGIAPVCLDPEHEEADGSVYDCCPEPAIEVEAPELAEYLVALLNTDAPGGAA